MAVTSVLLWGLEQMWYNTPILNRINDRGATGIAHGLTNTYLGGVDMSKHTPSPVIIKSCAFCGADFSTTNNNYKYCTPDCRKAAYKPKQSEYNRSYRERCPDRFRESQRVHRQKNLNALRENNRMRMREWREENPEVSRERARAYYDRNSEDRREYQRRYRVENAQRVAAQWAVNDAVRSGKMPHVKTQKCVRCDSDATEYHHWSYEEVRWLDVEPMCPTCHARADRERMAGESQ